MKNLKIYLLPKTCLGGLAFKLLIAFLVSLGTLFLFVSLGERGGVGLLSNLKLAIPGLFAAALGVGGFWVGIVSLVKERDYSLAVLLATLGGFFVLFWVLGEVLFPH